MEIVHVLDGWLVHVSDRAVEIVYVSDGWLMALE